MSQTDALHDIAEAALASQQLQRALQTYAEIVALDSGDVGAMMMQGAIEAELGNLERAAAHLQQAVDLDPEFGEAWTLLASVFGRLNRFADAETAYKATLRLTPGNNEARLNLANALKSQGKFQEAAACYREALQSLPTLQGGWIQFADTLLACGDPQGAEQAARRALSNSPADAVAQSLLGRALFEQGRPGEAAPILQQATTLAPNDPDRWSMAAAALGASGDLKEAEACCRKALAIDPDHADAWLNLGNTLQALGQIEDSAEAFRRATECAPDRVEAHCSLGTAYAALTRYPLAIASYQRAIELRAGEAELHRCLGNLHALDGNFEAAEQACRRAVELVPATDNYLELADVLARTGSLDEAHQYYDQALAHEADSPRALAGKARAFDRERKFDEAMALLEPHLESMAGDTFFAAAFAGLSKRFGRQEEAVRMAERCLAQDDLVEFERIKMHYTASQLLDRLGEHEQAFEHIRKASALKKASFDASDWRAFVDTMLFAYRQQAFSRLSRSTNESERPVFIVGMPRSGTSLVEQIIATHPRAFGAGELREIGDIPRKLSAASLQKAPFPRCLEALPEDALTTEADAYLAKIEHLAGNESIITDKMPQNFVYLGLIEQLFPKARIVHIRRNPIDTCLSCYFQNFAGHIPWSYDLANLGHYYREYERLMEHWHQVLSLPILDIEYESLVREPERYSRQLVEFCGLEWDDACLEFHNSRRVVNTASYDQVRQPVYTRSVERWKAYEEQLAPLLSVLQGEA